MAKKEHKPAKSNKQVYAERRTARIWASCEIMAAKDSAEWRA
jgi:hypothetical protein